MNAFLRGAYESIRDLLAETGRAEVRTRHAIGLIISDVKRSRHKYGARAVAQLSEALGTDEQTLYRCASVAECWTQPQLDALLQRTTAHGQPLSFSHFILLSSVPSPARRAALFERAVRESLSVRSLAALVEDDADASSGRTSTAVERLARTTDRLAREIESVHSKLLSDLVAAQAHRTDARVVLEKALEANERLRALLNEQSARLQAHREKLRTQPSLPPMPRLLLGME